MVSARQNRPVIAIKKRICCLCVVISVFRQKAWDGIRVSRGD